MRPNWEPGALQGTHAEQVATLRWHRDRGLRQAAAATGADAEVYRRMVRAYEKRLNELGAGTQALFLLARTPHVGRDEEEPRYVRREGEQQPTEGLGLC